MAQQAGRIIRITGDRDEVIRLTRLLMVKYGKDTTIGKLQIIVKAEQASPVLYFKQEDYRGS
jgi:hypothetical protein